MESKFWQVRALAGWGLLLGVPAVVIVGIDLVMKTTYNEGRGDGLKEAKEHVRFNICVRQLFKDRADSFFNPATGRLEASGFGNNYARLLADQRSRAGTFDYKRRG